MNTPYITVLFLFLQTFYVVICKNARDADIQQLSSLVEDGNKEPSCDELRKMWRHTKREMQQQSTDTVVPRYKSTRYHEPFTYGWKTQARPRNAMKYAKPVYGRIVHSPDKFLYRNNIPDRYQSFDQVARMVGSPTYYTPTLTAAPKTFFRLEYPVRRPMVPVRISHIGRFQELQSVLRNDRANELQMRKLKDSPEGTETMNPNYNEENSNDRYRAYSEEEDVSSKGRKLRGTENGMDIEQAIAASNKNEDSVSVDLIGDTDDSSKSTSKPVPMDDNIPRRWALGEWRR